MAIYSTALTNSAKGNMLASLVRETRKWSRVYSIFFQDALVYKATAVIWLLTDTVPAIIMPLVWLSSFNGRAAIGGFNPSQIVVYYMVVLFLSCTVESHIMWDMAGEIKNGKFNISLIRPYSYMAYWYASNVSWRLMRTLIFIPLFTIVLLMFGRWVHWNGAAYNYGWAFWTALVLGHFVSFTIAYAMGLISLYVVEASSIYYFYYLPVIIFNGQIAPINFFPPVVAEVGKFMPFQYTLSLPAQIFVGHVRGNAIYEGLALQCLWIVLAYGLSILLWRGGLKRYTAYGI